MTVENRVFESIDYLSSSELFRASAEHKTKLQCKFVILKSNNQYWLIYGSLRDFNYHALLIDKYCNQNGIAGGWRRKPDLFEIYDKRINVVGGGWFEFDFSKNRFRAFGRSTAYGSVDARLVKELVQSDKMLSQFKI